MDEDLQNKRTFREIALTALLSLPAQALILSLGIFVALIFQDLFNLPWTSGEDIFNFNKFFEFLFTSIHIYLIYILIYMLIPRKFKEKFKYYILASSTIGLVFSLIAFDIIRPVISFVFSGFGHHIANAVLFSSLMFASFVVLIIKLGKLTSWSKGVIERISAGLSLLLGGILSFVVWSILFLGR